MQVLLDARGQWPAEMSVEELRHAWSVYTQALARPAATDLTIADREIPTADYSVPVRIYRSSAQSEACILYMHGGGFIKGDLDSSDSIAWGVAKQTNATVVSVDYRLTPEHPYPAAFNDCYGVLCWLAEHSESVGIDARRIALLGDSAGANLATALCLAARDRNGPHIAAQANIYPGYGGDTTVGSYVEHADGPLLTTESVRKYMSIYTQGATHAQDPYALPLQASDLSNLPPALVHTAEIDPIREDGRRYAAALALAGNSVVFREAKGMLHGFLRARFGGPAAAAEFDAMCRFLQAQLSTG